MRSAIPKLQVDRRNRTKSGSVAAELAAILPLLTLITFGSIQVANTIHFKQALTSAAFEGTRLATGATANRQQIEDRVQAMLDARRVVGAEISITPAGELRQLPTGTQIDISVSAPTASNVTGPSFVLFTNTITATGRTIR